MVTKVKKTKKASGATGDAEELAVDDKLAVLQANYTHAKKVLPDYKALNKELGSYDVGLPEEVDIPDISKINKLYAIAQSYISRVTVLEMTAIGNHTLWIRLCNLMRGYIEDRESDLLDLETIKELRNARTQQAALRRKLKKEYNRLEMLQDCLTEAESFKRIVEAKKKDLTLVLTNLNRQVKALGLERGTNF